MNRSRRTGRLGRRAPTAPPRTSRVAELSEANRLLRLAEQLAHVGHWRVDVGAPRPIWSDEVFRIHGLEPADAAPDMDAAFAFYHPDDRPRVHAHVATAIAEGSDLSFEARLVRPDGTMRDVLSRATCETDDSGAVVAIFGVFVDITDLRTSERRLAETSALLDLAKVASGAGVWFWDIDSGTVTHSAENARIHGLPVGADGVTRTTIDEWTALVHPDDRARLWADVDRALQEGTTTSTEFRVPRPDGSTAWVLGLGTILRDPSGRPVAVHGIDLDITTRKAAEAELVVAKRAAEEASAAKTRFLATMSHEVRTPLNGILGNADLLAELLAEHPADGAVTGPDARRAVEAIRMAAASLRLVVDDVLDMAKIEAGRIEFDPRPFSLAALVDGALAIVAPMADAKGLALAAHLPDGGPDRVVGDEGRLRQVLLNLLANAVKFTARGKVVLRVAVRGRDAESVTLRLSVQDTGIGIADDQRDRLFHRFSQIPGIERGEDVGTGLGLAICRELVGLMGGEIDVLSEPGVGSTFFFTLTLPVAPAPEDVASVPAPAFTITRGARLLLVEDVPINRDLARAVLERAGYVVATANDGAAALDALARETFDLVLMDVRMPVMDGVAAVRRLRAGGGAAAATPVVAMTANVLPDQIAALRIAGFDDHVGKPFDRLHLFETIERHLGAAPVAAVRGVPLETLLPTARVTEMQAEFRHELDARFRSDDPEDLAHDAHALVTAAGLLGFDDLASACRALEEACRGGGSIAAARARVDGARRAALARIAGTAALDVS